VNPNDRPFRRLHKALHMVNLYEAEHDHPLPGAMVVRSSDGQPGEGFYWSAREAGRKFDASPAPNGHHVGPAAIAYWRLELQSLIDYWSAPERQEPHETQLDRIARGRRLGGAPMRPGVTPAPTSPSAPQFQDRLSSEPSRLCSPLASLDPGARLSGALIAIPEGVRAPTNPRSLRLSA
jgi:hypothetical protein